MLAQGPQALGLKRFLRFWLGPRKVKRVTVTPHVARFALL